LDEGYTLQRRNNKVVENFLSPNRWHSIVNFQQSRVSSGLLKVFRFSGDTWAFDNHFLSVLLFATAADRTFAKGTKEKVFFFSKPMNKIQQLVFAIQTM
jgi:hypothetical protein